MQCNACMHGMCCYDRKTAGAYVAMLTRMLMKVCNAGADADACIAMQARVQMHANNCKQDSRTQAMRGLKERLRAEFHLDDSPNLGGILLREVEFLSLPQKLTWHASTHTITTASQTYLTKPLPTSPLHFSHPSSTTSPLHFNHPTLQARHLHFTSPTLKTRHNKARQTRIIQAFCSSMCIVCSHAKVGASMSCRCAGAWT